MTSNTDGNKSTGKPRQRGRKVEQRGQKPDQQRSPEPEQLLEPSEQIGAAPTSTEIVPTDIAPVGTIAAAESIPVNIQTIANAYREYGRRSFEQVISFVEKLTTVRSLDKAVEVQAEFARQSYQTFVAESERICGLYGELAKQTLKPLESLVPKASRTLH